MRGQTIVFVIAASCAGTLGQRGHRAPPGLAFCEPAAVQLERADDPRIIRVSCSASGRVTVTDSDGYAATASPDDAVKLWDAIEDTGPLPSCPGDGTRYVLTVYGDDGDVERADCPLGADARFDRVLGAVMALRHPPPPARTTWVDIDVVAQQ